MSRRVIWAALIVSAFVGTGAARAADVSLTPLSGTEFPNRAFVLNLPPGAVPAAADVSVTEDGVPVDGLTVAPAATAVQRRLGEVLILDTSGSMQGAPLAGAMSAARTFAAHRLPAQPLAVVAFNSVATTVLPFTSDANKISAALSVPPAASGGTHIYDAVQSALKLVQSAHLAGASFVVLSDGSDRGSTSSPTSIAAAARALHVRTYSVGLRSGSFDPATLRGLATDTSGAYSEASSPRKLVAIYQALGSRLANQYVVRYRSLAAPRALVQVSAAVRGLPTAATARYLTPALAAPGAARSTRSTWSSPGARIAIVALVALLLALAIAVALRSRQTTVRERVEPFVPQTPLFGSAVEDADELGDGPSFLADAERRLAGRPRWDRLAEAFEIAEIPIAPVPLAGLTFVGTVLVMWGLAAVTQHPLVAVLGLGVPLGAFQWVKIKLQQRRRLFGEQLADNLQIVASALRAGHGFVGALGNVVDDAPEPSRSEFRRVLAEERLGTPIEEALAVTVHRMASDDLNQVALVATLQRETGGNAAEVLERVVDSIRERVAVRRLLRTLTAQGRFGGIIVSALPPVVLVALTALNPSFMKPLYATTAGNLILVLAGVFVISGWLVIRRIISFEI